MVKYKYRRLMMEEGEILKRKFIFLLIAVLVLSLILVGCGNDTGGEAPPADEGEITETADTGEAEEVEPVDLPEGVVAFEEFEEFYPAVVKTFQKNAEMVSTTYGGSEPIDYLEKHPYLNTFYEGYIFSIQYDRARGHVYALEDAVNTARPKRGASCLACKVSEYHLALADDPSVASADFQEFVDEHVTVGMTCYDCHGETPGEVNVMRDHILLALEDCPEADGINEKQLACAQCHVEYYQTEEDVFVRLPWTEGLGAEEALAYYDNIDFADWEHPRTGARLLKAQHPETETFEGSVHDEMKIDCLTCHMPRVEVDGEKINSHHWTSPLHTIEESSCLKCHGDETVDSMIEMVEGVQKIVVDKTEEVALKLEGFINLFGEKLEAGVIDEETKANLQKIHREAQWYWDYVFVENGEGFHNRPKQMGYLETSENLVDEGMEILNNL